MGAPSIKTIKRLYGLSSNRCAFPKCDEAMIDTTGITVGRVCHIKGDRPGSPRYDPGQTEEERQAFENLILLCPNHHVVVDGDVTTYPVDVVMRMKADHEAKSTKEFKLDDRTAQRIVATMAGGAIAAGIGAFAREIVGFLQSLREALPQEKQTEQDPLPRLLRDLGETLRYGPKGIIRYYAPDELHLQLAGFFVHVFKEAGWRDGSPLDLSEPGKDYHELFLLFSLSSEHQLKNAVRTVLEVLKKCGFTQAKHFDEYRSVKDSRLTVRVIFDVGNRP